MPTPLQHPEVAPLDLPDEATNYALQASLGTSLDAALGNTWATPGLGTAQLLSAGQACLDTAQLLTPGQLTPGQLTPGQLTPGQLTPGQLTPGGSSQIGGQIWGNTSTQQQQPPAGQLSAHCMPAACGYPGGAMPGGTMPGGAMPGGAMPSLAQLQQSIGAGLVPPQPLSLGQHAPPVPGMSAHQQMSAQQHLSLAQQYEQYASTIPNLLPVAPMPDNGNVQLQSQAHAQVHAQLQAQAQATAQLQAQLQASQLQTAQLQAQAQSHAHAQVNAQSQAQAQAQAHMFAAAQLMSMCGLGPGMPGQPGQPGMQGQGMPGQGMQGQGMQGQGMHGGMHGGMQGGMHSGYHSGALSGAQSGSHTPDAHGQMGSGYQTTPGTVPYHGANGMPDFSCRSLPTGARSVGAMSQSSAGGSSHPGSGASTPSAQQMAARRMHPGRGGGPRSSGNQSDEEAGGNFRRRRRQDNREEDRMLYALNLARVRIGDDQRTTLMVRNIPNKYNQKMLLATIEDRHEGKFDLLYLPIDFKNRCNVGYAFINFISTSDILAFYVRRNPTPLAPLAPPRVEPAVEGCQGCEGCEGCEVGGGADAGGVAEAPRALRPNAALAPSQEEFNHKKWDRFNSDKVCEITYARIQGKISLITHFENSSLIHEDEGYQPIIFASDGSGRREKLPLGGGSTWRPIGPRMGSHGQPPPNGQGPPSNGHGPPPMHHQQPIFPTAPPAQQ